MIKIEGRVRNLQIEDSKIHTLKNIEKQAVGSAMLGTLASSSALMTNAPILLMAASGEDAKSFTCEVGDYRLIGQFTTVQFKNGDEQVWVISREKEQGRHLTYAVLDPKTGLLYMMYELGRSLKKAYNYNNKVALFLGLVCFSFISILILGSKIYYGGSVDIYFNDIIKYLFLSFIISFLFSFSFSYLVFGRVSKKMGVLSDKIFKVLGFKIIEQDFYNDCIVKDGIHISVMEYRKNLKGPDPYPEDYFDKKKVSE
ncbi:hypothetical protein ACINWC323_1085 [Acinetobacter sp. WC-323]|uniref:putative type VI secretion system effector n=1 Tax=Acinetobacter sp. WC-323 TaxID=903918 RepID=UPI00029E6986|nr:putative type VI secretion system effector [Acinetobacter sp. WC-323]EKU58178.1 hypothetical protein ACINWC323_1085 [Acinetobacter sp. WC-323]